MEKNSVQCYTSMQTAKQKCWRQNLPNSVTDTQTMLLYFLLLLADVTSLTLNTLQTNLTHQKMEMLPNVLHTCLSPHKNLNLHFEISLPLLLHRSLLAFCTHYFENLVLCTRYLRYFPGECSSLALIPPRFTSVNTWHFDQFFFTIQ